MPTGRAEIPRPSIEEAETEFLNNLALLDDTLLQYEYILSFAGDVDELPEEACVEGRKVAGCASNAWMELSCDGGQLRLQLNADALVIKGLLGMLTWLLGGRPLDDVVAWEPKFLDDQRLKPLLNSDRRHGVSSIVAAVRAFCRDSSPTR